MGFDVLVFFLLVTSEGNFVTLNYYFQFSKVNIYIFYDLEVNYELLKRKFLQSTECIFVKI